MLEEVGLLSTGLLLLGYVHGHCIGVIFESLRLSGRLFEVKCLGDFDLIVLERRILVVSKKVVDQSRDDTAQARDQPEYDNIDRFIIDTFITDGHRSTNIQLTYTPPLSVRPSATSSLGSAQAFPTANLPKQTLYMKLLSQICPIVNGHPFELRNLTKRITSR
jgi:hypothetical protein